MLTGATCSTDMFAGPTKKISQGTYIKRKVNCIQDAHVCRGQLPNKMFTVYTLSTQMFIGDTFKTQTLTVDKFNTNMVIGNIFNTNMTT